MILHLDKDFKPLDGEEIQYESFTFSGGEPHIKINPNFDTSKSVSITHRINSFNDLGLLCVAVDALLRLDVTLDKLIIPYFPAARQDRVMVKGEPLSAKIYADIINRFGFKKVVIFDPHSDVTPALLNHCEVINNHQFIKNVVQTIGDVLLIAPDAGALKKIYAVSESLGGLPVISCSKSRDVKTGKLSGFEVYANDLNGKNCLIVDDICDGGGTFIGLAQALKNKNAGKLFLAVSHGIFSKGLGELECFERIFTTDSIRKTDNTLVEQIKLNF